MAKENETLTNYHWFFSILIIMSLSVIIAWIIPGSFFNLTLTNYITWILVSAVFSIVIILIIAKIFKLPIRFPIALILIFVISTTFLYCYTDDYVYISSDFVLTPDLVDKNQSDAQNILIQHNLTPKITYQTVSDNSKVNIVLSQNPPSGLSVPKNTTINLVVGILEYVKIDSPQNGSLVDQNMTVVGTVKNLQTNETVYLLVQPQPRGGDGPYEWYVQPAPFKFEDNGTWRCKAYFGQTGDEGRTFKIVAITTFDRFGEMKYGFNLPEYRSISELIYVTRKKN